MSSIALTSTVLHIIHVRNPMNYQCWVGGSLQMCARWFHLKLRSIARREHDRWRRRALPEGGDVAPRPGRVDHHSRREEPAGDSVQVGERAVVQELGPRRRHAGGYPGAVVVRGALVSHARQHILLVWFGLVLCRKDGGKGSTRGGVPIATRLCAMMVVSVW